MYTRLLLALAFLCMTLPSSAQDTMYIVKRGVVVAHITEMGKKLIRYQTPEGEERKVLVEDVKWLVLQDGTRMYRARAGKDLYLKEGVYHPPIYGRNLITIAPFQLTNLGVQHGLSYERTLDTNAVFRLSIPFAYANFKGGDLGSFENGTGGVYFYNRHIFSLSPTLKVFVGSKAPVQFSTGIGLYLASGKREYARTRTGPLVNEFIHHLGFFVQNALNLNVSQDAYIGFQATTGYYYWTVPSLSLGGRKYLLGTGILFGYRF
jgi:hypothetical protein